MLRGIQVGTGHWGQKLYNAFKNKADIIGYVNNGNSSLGEVPKMDWYDALASDVDFMIIATPIENLVDCASWALCHGKHIFLEKPGAKNLSELNFLKICASLANKQIFVGYKFVYDHLIELIDNRESVEIMWNKQGSYGNDIILNLASHHLSIMKKIYGNIEDFKITLMNDNSVCGQNNKGSYFSINRDSKLKYHKI